MLLRFNVKASRDFFLSLNEWFLQLVENVTVRQRKDDCRHRITCLPLENNGVRPRGFLTLPKKASQAETGQHSEPTHGSLYNFGQNKKEIFTQAAVIE